MSHPKSRPITVGVYVAMTLAMMFGACSASAMSVDWSGDYRIEYFDLTSAYMTTNPYGQAGVAVDPGRKSYFLNHLNLTPKITPLDGFSIVANFEVLPSTQYPGSQVGSDFGMNNYQSASYPSGTITQSAGAANNFETNQLYMTWNQEYGALAVGRMPIQFGLGISHNSGQGPWDHWIETHDIISYKVMLGNLSITPMFGRLAHTTPSDFVAGFQGTEGMIDLDYTNPETESTFAIFHQIRNAGPSANDAYAFFAPYEGTQNPSPSWGTPPQNGYGPQVLGGLNTTLTSLYIARGWERFKFRMEAGFASGSTGVQYVTYNQGANPVGGNGIINLSGYGIAIEMEVPRNNETKWDFNFRTGIASGDNPSTQNFEGFFFDRNYNIAMLLFNQPLGQNNYDVLRDHLQRTRAGNIYNIYDNAYTADEEVLSNAIYFSPKFDYLISDHWEWINALTYAIVQTNPSLTYNSVGSDIGVEYDVGIVYRPHPKFQWLTELGIFDPGSVWKEGGNRDASYFTWGLQTKASLSF